jgi:hypothetical protein
VIPDRHVSRGRRAAAVPKDLTALFRERAAALGVTILDAPPDPRDGDRTLRAAGGIAGTGSVILTGDQAARRPLLAASRVIVEVDPAAIVAYPGDSAPLLADGDALILTGASRTADIEKQIVRGIHGAEELLVVLPDPPSRILQAMSTRNSPLFTS